MIAAPLRPLHEASPPAFLAVSASLVLAITASALLLLIQQPWLGLSLVPGHQGLQVAAVDSDSPWHGRIAPGAEIVALAQPGGSPFTLEPGDLGEEPDQLPTSLEERRFFARQGTLHDLLAAPEVTLILQDGTASTAAPLTQRPFSSIPATGWFQWLVAMLTALLSLGVLAFRRDSAAAWLYGVSGVALALASWSAGIYSSRELALDGLIFHALSIVNHLGAVGLYAPAILGLFIIYPVPLVPRRWLMALFLLFLGIWAAESVDLIQDNALAIHLPTLATTLIVFGLAGMQWWATGQAQLERAALKWIVLTYVLGTALFIGLIALPGALGVAPPIDQGSAFLFFLYGFAGLAAGVGRFRLFELDYWWPRIWGWVLGGGMVVGLDMLFVMAMELPAEWGLWLALGLSGWLYFPLRQWLWGRWSTSPRQHLERHLPDLVRDIASAPSAAAMATAWQHLLDRMFRPLHLKEVADPAKQPRLEPDGVGLTVPGLIQGTALALTLPDRGKRLFHPLDLSLAEAALALARQAFGVRQAQDEGVRQERSRITRELHDGLGGTLLAILHSSATPEEGGLARKAWQELREIMTALEGISRPLSAAVADWRGDLRAVVASTQVNMEWHDTIGDDPWLSPTMQLHARRILAEGVTNALRHAAPATIRVEVAHAEGLLRLVVANDGDASPPEYWVKGRGMLHIQRRVQSLGGTVSWQAATPSGTRMEAHIPLAHNREPS